MTHQYAIDYKNTGCDWLILDFSPVFSEIDFPNDESISQEFETVEQAQKWIDDYFLVLCDN